MNDFIAQTYRETCDDFIIVDISLNASTYTSYDLNPLTPVV